MRTRERLRRFSGIERPDAAGLAALAASARTLIAPVAGEDCLVAGEDPVRMARLSADERPELIRAARSLTLLGEFEGRPVLAVDVSGLADDAWSLPEGTRFANLRSVYPLLDEAEAEILGCAKALARWHGRRRFCGVCGAITEAIRAGHERRCSSPKCGALVFPRTDPAVLILATSGRRCLLGRQASWPEGMYSALAGFVEPGESLEEAVERELFEEAGVRGKAARYVCSQPWPFPASLMVAFEVEAESEEIRPGDGELEDARWFTREGLAASFAARLARLPMSRSASFRLIEQWYDAGGGQPLRGVLAGLGVLA